MKKPIFAFFALPFLLTNYALAQSCNWAQKYGDVNYSSSGSSITLDSLGNIYTCGGFQGIIDFDPGPAVTTLTSTNEPNLFIKKTDTHGNFIWAKSIAVSFTSLNSSYIKTDLAGNVYVTGSGNFSSGNYSGVDFDPGVGTFTLAVVSNTGYILKLNSAGNFIWAKNINLYASNYAKIGIDTLQNIYIADMFTNTQDFDPGVGTYTLTAGANMSNIYVMKLNKLGNFVWAKNLGTNIQNLTSLAVDYNGGTYTIGSFVNTVDFDPGMGVYNQTSLGQQDIYMLKLDSSGNFGWAKSYGINSPMPGQIDYGVFITCDGLGNSYSVVYEDNNHKILKHSASGNLIWSKIIGNNSTQFYSLSLDGIGNLVSAGNVGTSTYFDSQLITSYGALDGFILKQKCSNGNIVDVKQIGGSNYDFLYGMVADKYSGVYFTGKFNGTADFNPSSSTINLTSPSATNTAIFIGKYVPGILSYSINSTSCIGGNTGSASLIPDSSASGYSVLWDNNQTGLIGNNLSSGNHSVIISYPIGCTNTLTLSVAQTQVITAINTSTVMPTCFGYNNGIAAVTSITGGTTPYTFTWSASAQATQTVTNLIAGTYTVIIKDVNSCTNKTVVNITQPTLLTILTYSVYPNTKCSGSCNGYIDSGADGGTPPSAGYVMQWDANTNNQTGPQAYNLCEGTYVFTVTDANGCTTSKAEYVGAQTVVDPNIFLTNLAAVDQLNVSPSFSTYYSYSLPTTITPNPSNPRNFVDPGKRARFKVECTNQKANGQSIVSGICKVRSANQYITITDSSSALNNVGWNGTKWSADEFEINIDPNTPPGTNAYIDFIVQETGLKYETTCIAIPITPLVYTDNSINLPIDDDSNPDSQGNDNDICDPQETIEFYPWLDNISQLNAEYVRGRFENLDNHPFINIWNGVPGVNTTVYDATWWNYSFGQPQVINSGMFYTTPEYDFVFDYNNTSTINNFKLYMVMAGGFKLFSGNALSLVQWSLPYTFNNTNVISVNELDAENLSIIISPNPTSEIVNIKSNSILKDTKIKLFNAQGQLIFESKQIISELNMSNQPKGIYFIQLVSEDKIVTQKIILQ